VQALIGGREEKRVKKMRNKRKFGEVRGTGVFLPKTTTRGREGPAWKVRETLILSGGTL